MMRFGKSLLVGILLAVLAACGGTTATSSNQVASPPTATVMPGRATVAPTNAPSSAPAPVPTAVVAPTATRPPAASSPPATRPPSAAVPPAPTPIPQPNGAIPPGWQVYRGPADFPVVVAYPPDWTLDTSLLQEQRVIFIVGPNGGADNEAIEIAGSAQQTEANIDVLRDEYFYKKSDYCDKRGIEYTTYRRISDAQFAMLGAACDSSDTLTFIQVASGLKAGDEWSIAMRTPYERKEAVVQGIFDPMLASVNVYGLLTP